MDPMRRGTRSKESRSSAQKNIRVELRKMDARLVKLKRELDALGVREAFLENKVRNNAKDSSSLSLSIERVNTSKESLKRKLRIAIHGKPLVDKNPANRRQSIEIMNTFTEESKTSEGDGTPVKVLRGMVKPIDTRISILITKLDHGFFEKELYETIALPSVVEKDIVIYSESKPSDLEFSGRTSGTDLFFEDDENPIFMGFQFIISLNILVAGKFSTAVSMLVSSMHESSKVVQVRGQTIPQAAIYSTLSTSNVFLTRDTRKRVFEILSGHRTRLDELLSEMELFRNVSTRERRRREPSNRKVELNDLQILLDDVEAFMDIHFLNTPLNAYTLWKNTEYVNDDAYFSLLGAMHELNIASLKFVKWLSTIDSIGSKLDYNKYKQGLLSIVQKNDHFGRYGLDHSYKSLEDAVLSLAGSALKIRDAFTIQKIQSIGEGLSSKKVLLFVGGAHERNLREVIEQTKENWVIYAPKETYSMNSFFVSLLKFTNHVEEERGIRPIDFTIIEAQRVEKYEKEDDDRKSTISRTEQNYSVLLY